MKTMIAMQNGTSRHRAGPSGEAANELESLLTAVMTSADLLADGDLADRWVLLRELGALEEALKGALSVVGRLSALAHEKRQALRERAGIGSASLAGVLGDAVLELDPRFDT